MKRLSLCVAAVLLISCSVRGQDTERRKTTPWLGKYPMSFFTKTRTSKTVGKDRLSVGLKLQSIACDEMLLDECYEDMSATDKNDKFKAVLTAKYGWAADHHIAVGIPYVWADFESASLDIHANGLGNVFVFEKWNCVKETSSFPGLALDVWYYFPTGDPDNKLGLDEAAIKVTAEISKAWRWFNVHLNPGYSWNLDGGCDIEEVNVGGFYNARKTLLLGVEYNYTDKDEKGSCHDIVPGFVWEFAKGASFKLGAVINADSTMKYRDEVGVVSKLFYKF